MSVMEGKTARRAVALGATLAIAIGGSSTAPTGAASAARHHAPERNQSVSAPVTRVLAARSTARAAYSPSARWSGAVNTYDRAAVNAAYWRDYAPGLSVPTGYTGNDSTCSAGTTSPQSQAATLGAINFVRSLSGLYPVALSPTLSARSQYTALMMSANRTLSHHPSPGWRCYTATGAANAGRSNLALSYPTITSAGAIGLYMQEQGSSNYAVGHRRWLLYPFTTAMGTGATNSANSLTVVGPTDGYRPNPSWVSWPSAGYFPTSLEPNGRWSLSTGYRNFSFKKARVKVWRNGVLVRTAKNRVVNGYGMPTVVWQMPASISRSGTFRVQVTGIRAGRKKFSKTYSVTMFTPSQ
jgi:uncharacterized protein YkwD